MADQISNFPSTSSVSSSTSEVTIPEELPYTFNVRYLGFREARGLWGIKHTRVPVETMINSVKRTKTSLNIMKLTISKEGCTLESIYKRTIEQKFFPIKCVSYGVQDVAYTKVFSMIIVKEVQDFPDQSPFECHAFACDSGQTARKLTHTLAVAFKEYSRKIRSSNIIEIDTPFCRERDNFGIDLRSPEELENDLKSTDSEA